MLENGRKRKRGRSHPYLSGNFAPVTKTHPPTPCTYTGTIPPELIGGEYVRNGGNPVSNDDLGRDAHWFDGDGMLAGVLFERSSDGSDDIVAKFVNQFILTDLCLSSMEQEGLLQTPILPSIATLVNPAVSLIAIILRILRSVLLVLLSHLPGSKQAVKRISVANTHILFHDGRALATCESGPPIRIQLPELETVGWFDGNRADGEPESNDVPKDATIGGTGLLSFMKEWTTGHPKVDHDTGEMILYHCNFVAPYVHYSVIPSSYSVDNTAFARLLNAPVPGCTGGKMMHDFGVSKQHTVIMDLPLTLTPFNLIKNEPIVSYEPGKPARFGIFPRYDPTQVRWYETAGCCIFHTANTWDETDTTGHPVAVNLLACRLTSASLVYSAGNLRPPPHPSPSQQRRPMSFFASYDNDEMCDIEKTPLEEKHQFISEESPLLTTPTIPIAVDDEEQCRLYLYRFALDTLEPTVISQYALSSIPFEFPTLNPAFEMKEARYIYGCSTSNESFGAALGKATKIDVLVKMDVKELTRRAEGMHPRSVTGCVDTRSMLKVLNSGDDEDPIRCFQMPLGWYAQEARFVSRQNPHSEDDGYLLFYAFDECQLDGNGRCRENAFSELWILDAKTMANVVARVRLPQRVPYGLHGNWFSGHSIANQRPYNAVRKLPPKGFGKSAWSSMRKRLIGLLG